MKLFSCYLSDFFLFRFPLNVSLLFYFHLPVYSFLSYDWLKTKKEKKKFSDGNTYEGRKRYDKEKKFKIIHSSGCISVEY